MDKERDPRTHAIIGAAMEVHRELGCGFLEAVYQEAFELELCTRGIPYEREVPLPISFKGTLLKAGYCVDFICFDSVVVELKALSRLSSVEEALAINYLKAAEHAVGLLLNFGFTSLEFRRFVLETGRSRTQSAKSA